MQVRCSALDFGGVPNTCQTGAKLSIVPVEFSTRAASEVVALNVFEHAEGVPVTHAMVVERIAELLAHPAGCPAVQWPVSDGGAGKARPSAVSGEAVAGGGKAHPGSSACDAAAVAASRSTA